MIEILLFILQINYILFQHLYPSIIIANEKTWWLISTPIPPRYYPCCGELNECRGESL
jgi:hypothetical protein